MSSHEEKRIKTTQELYEVLEKPWLSFIKNELGTQVLEIPGIFRGKKDVAWELRPTVGRISHYDLDWEKEVLELFKKGARPHLKDFPKNNWEWLALAQHHGLPTRLLDWTRNPLAATYFAVEEETSTDSVVYMVFAPMQINPAHFENPFEYNEEYIVYRPEDLSPRVIAQQGLFTIHKDPKSSFKGWRLKIIIPNALRKRIKSTLYTWGINRETLFPDLDGLAANIKYWTAEDKLEGLDLPSDLTP